MATILYADDDSGCRDSLKRSLELLGHVVRLAINIETAQSALKEGKFDIVIFDGSLKSKGDGADMALKLHRTGQKVIIFSGDEKNRRKGVRFLPKPSKEKLEDVIAEVLSN